ncbi:DNA distortion polypeptide 1, partial [Escherichia coli]|nr:DNA distortion polypeptide 1 [Escherichia coli]
VLNKTGPQSIHILRGVRQQQDEPGRFSICSRQAAVVLDKDGFYQDAERLTTEIFNLKNQFENYIMLCKGRTVSNKVEM